MRGDIETPWAGRAKEYSWSLCLGMAPRKITPTDIDYVCECNKKFAFFEMKTAGSTIPRGQELMFLRLLEKLGQSAVLFVVEHSMLEKVTVPVDVIRFHCCRVQNGRWARSAFLPGDKFAEAYAAFFKWAETGNFSLMRNALREGQKAA